jgi:hemerythrin
MNSFIWNNNFVTGLSTVDKQHRHLIDLINQLGELLAENRIDHDDLENFTSELIDYSQYHFSEEESAMSEIGIDHRHLHHHINSHKGFLREVTLLQQRVSRKEADSGKRLLDFLANWLAFHILGDDQNMARQIRSIRAGADATEAFDKEERQSDNATESLLTALSQLFDQVSSRNRELVLLNQSLEEKVADRTKELLVANEKLMTASLTDSLTGLKNRRHAMIVLEALWKEAVLTDKPLACMMVDADHFKEVNDTYGHDAGDVVLQTLAQGLAHSLRTDDMVCRLGGDEFLIICPNTDNGGALHIAEHTRRKVAELRVPTGGEPWHGSVSIGVAVRGAEMKDHNSLIKLADQSVYAAKEAGKNCVKSAG